MTKSFLSVFMLVFIFSASAMACRPGPMPECKKRNLIINSGQFAALLKQVGEYQQLLSANIVLPENRTSCFNNGFANFYGGLLQEELKSNNNRTCGEQLVRVKTAVKELINPKSPENKAVLDKSIQTSLQKLADKISREIKVLPRH